jgi:hypothetical protein
MSPLPEKLITIATGKKKVKRDKKKSKPNFDPQQTQHFHF